MPSDDWAQYRTPLDLLALGEYVAMLEVGLPRLIESEHERIWRGVRPDDRGAVQYATFAQWQLDDGITTRFLTAAVVVAAWATYESAVKRNAERIRQSRQLRLKLRDVRGDTFLDYAQKYYEGVLGCELHPVGTDWGRLQDLYAIRNALAHANGQLDDEPEPVRRRIEEISARYQGLRIADGFILVSMDFLSDAYQRIEQLLSELERRTNKITSD